MRGCGLVGASGLEVAGCGGSGWAIAEGEGCSGGGGGGRGGGEGGERERERESVCRVSRGGCWTVALALLFAVVTKGDAYLF